MNDWVLYSIATAVIIGVEFVMVKKYTTGCDVAPDMAVFAWQARIASALLLSALLMWYIHGKGKEMQATDRRSWMYAFIVGALTSVSIVLFYKALHLASNPGYPTAIKELSLVFTFVFGVWFLGGSFKDIHPMVYTGMGLLLIGIYMIAKWSGTKASMIIESEDHWYVSKVERGSV